MWRLPLRAAVTVLGLCAAFTLAQTIAPSNDSSEIPPPASSPYFWVNASNVPAFRVVPLGWYNQISHNNFLTIKISGHLVSVGQSNVNSLASDAFDYISCDPTPGVLDASDIFRMTASAQPGNAIILYSTTANHCNTTSLNNVAVQNGIFTTLDPVLASTVEAAAVQSSNGLSATINPDLTSYTTSNSSNDGPQQYGAPGPTTAVAMIVLYTITGIITCLFIVIIVTGAIRAHRHPERYGPRNVAGRPRQSRAKGIAKAMLETLPIVKFGDYPDLSQKPPGGDVEMVGQHVETADSPNAADNTIGKPVAVAAAAETNSESRSIDDTTAKDQPSDSATAANTSSSTKPDGTDHDGNLGCSICTEDFKKGEDIRVLPCNHKFHPACVDPWLLNVSGTCPLCRIDLNGGKSDSASGEAENTGGAAIDSAPLGTVAGEGEAGVVPLAALPAHRRETIRHFRRIAALNREERVAALRRMRQQGNSGDNGAAQEDSRGLSTRLRERFRIRTRRQGEESTQTAATTEVEQTTSSR